MTDVNLKMLKDTDGNAFVPFSTTDAVFKDGTSQTVSDLLDEKQATLVSGTNIKTINGDSILGAGNITVSAEDEIAISTTEPTGNEILWIDPNEDLDAAAQILDGLPVGAECVYWGSTLPDTLLKEDGSQYDVDAYPELFEAIGHAFDLPGDSDSTKFRVPKHDGLTGVGIDTSDTDFDTLGETGGSKYLQAHSHTGTTGYGIVDSARIVVGTMVDRDEPNHFGSSGNGEIHDVSNTTNFPGGSHRHDFTTNETGTGDSGNVQPYIVKQYCIKARSNSVNISEVKRATTTSDNDVYSCNYVNDHFGGDILYSNNTGTTGNITLEKSVANYSYVEIIFRNADGEQDTTKIAIIGNDNKGVLKSVHYYDNVVYTYMKSVNLNGTSLTKSNTYSGGGYFGGAMGVQTTDSVYIIRVIGYK